LLDGRCSDGVQSTNPGNLCKTDNDCPTGRTGLFAKCRCGFNNNGSKYCEPEGGDTLWMTARKAVFKHKNKLIKLHVIVCRTYYRNKRLS